MLSGLTELGEGNFGKVYQATATGLPGLGAAPVPVAVKTLTAQTPEARVEFQVELPLEGRPPSDTKMSKEPPEVRAPATTTSMPHDVVVSR